MTSFPGDNHTESRRFPRSQPRTCRISTVKYDERLWSPVGCLPKDSLIGRNGFIGFVLSGRFYGAGELALETPWDRREVYTWTTGDVSREPLADGFSMSEQ